MTAAADQDHDVLEKVLQIVLRHLEGAAVETGKVAALVAELSASLMAQGTKPTTKVARAEPAQTAAAFEWPNRLGPPLPGLRQNEPAVPIDQSVHPKYITCLEDGRPLKMLKRWLMSEYGLTPDQYRARWGLPPDYPMIASELRRRKSNTATEQGFGQIRKKRAPAKRKPKA